MDTSTLAVAYRRSIRARAVPAFSDIHVDSQQHRVKDRAVGGQIEDEPFLLLSELTLSSRRRALIYIVSRYIV